MVDAQPVASLLRGKKNGGRDTSPVVRYCQIKFGKTRVSSWLRGNQSVEPPATFARNMKCATGKAQREARAKNVHTRSALGAIASAAKKYSRHTVPSTALTGLRCVLSTLSADGCRTWKRPTACKETRSTSGF